MNKKTIALAGNPNVGKSTVFNALTGMHQHTGNWPGKTIERACGTMKFNDTLFEFIDLPGAYSLDGTSPDEAVTSEYICEGCYDLIIIVVDATCMQRNLILAADILSITNKCILCLNLMDEAEKKKISIDIKKMKKMLGIPIIPIVARSKKGFSLLLHTIESFEQAETSPYSVNSDSVFKKCVSCSSEEPHEFDRRIDRIVTSKALGIPLMLLLLLFIFWLTITGANYPSQCLSSFFAFLEDKLRSLLEASLLPNTIICLLMDGLYTTLTWVISVMLPPMAIFFPLFTLLEDFGYLPRVAFNLDHFFRKCGAHGKQSLTMCMGFGCNACGVMGCRIIDSPRERLIAILTNCFVPCNGRFPLLITMILIFFTGTLNSISTFLAGLMLTAFIMLGIIMTLFVSKLLSATVLKGIPSSFILELPPYRIPKIGSVLIRSVLDRTLFVLGRSVMIAAPAGIVIWLLANIHIGEASLLDNMTALLDPAGKFLGLDGVILTAFILAFPANEIVIPVMLMCYMSTGILTDYSSLSQLHDILTDCGWTVITALNVMILCLFHFPCGTTCLTIKKETGSLKWTAFAFFLPVLTGIVLCAAINLIASFIFAST